MWSALFGDASVQAQGTLESCMLAGLSEGVMRKAVVDAALGPRPR